MAVEDIDGDGLPDIYLVSGQRDRLFRNLGGLRLADISDAVPSSDDGEGRGAYFVDYDNDGDKDLFVKEPNTLHFGVKQAKQIEKVEIAWPRGQRQTLSHLAVNAEHHVTEPSE